jgi:hypothetical protein
VVLLGFVISKARARSGVIRVCDKGISSSSEGSSSSHLENQFESSSLIFSKNPIHYYLPYSSGLKNSTKRFDFFSKDWNFLMDSKIWGTKCNTNKNNKERKKEEERTQGCGRTSV